MLISFEGIDGAGKSTQIRLLDNWSRNLGIGIHIQNEFSKTEVGSLLEKFLTIDPYLRMNKDYKTSVAETFLLMSDLELQTSKTLLPLFKNKSIIVKDRYLDTVIAYQTARIKEEYPDKNETALVEWISEAMKGICLEPDITILLKLPVEVAAKRLELGRNLVLRKNDIELLERANNVYEVLAKKYPKRIIEIDANKSIEGVNKEVIKILSPKIDKYYRNTKSKSS